MKFILQDRKVNNQKYQVSEMCSNLCQVQKSKYLMIIWLV